MAASVTTDFVEVGAKSDVPPFSLIQQKSLPARLLDELTRAARELSRDPAAFIRSSFSLDERDARQRKRLYLGLFTGVALHAACLTLIVAAGWHRVLLPVSEETNTIWLDGLGSLRSNSETQPKSEAPRGKGGGGGGGGQNDRLPAIHGIPPPMTDRPQIVAINKSPIEDPSLAIPTTLVGPNEGAPPLGPPGDPTSNGTVSGGPGTGGGAGRGEGTGVGDGTGPGRGPGRDGGSGGRTAGSPDGIVGGIGPIDWSDATRRRGFTNFRWTYRARAIVSPEAQSHKSAGLVLLKATFRADGTISDIQVVQPVEYMTEAAIESLKRCRFSPATLDGVPITLRGVPVKIPVTVEANP